MEKNHWVIPCNVKSYDVIGAFNKLGTVDWKQSKNMKNAQAGDIVFIYVGKPYSELKYMCVIQEVNKSAVTISDEEFIVNGKNYVNYGNYMELKLLKVISSTNLSLEKLKENGLKGNIQGPRRLNEFLLEYVLFEVENDSLEYINEPELENILFKEGKIIKQFGTKYERNITLRKKALEIHGTKCIVCGFDFEDYYGELGKGFIEVHHLNPMYTIRQEVVVNPKTDLVPVCSNCHKMIHRKKDKPLEIEELKKIIKS